MNIYTPYTFKIKCSVVLRIPVNVLFIHTFFFFFFFFINCFRHVSKPRIENKISRKTLYVFAVSFVRGEVLQVFLADGRRADYADRRRFRTAASSDAHSVHYACCVCVAGRLRPNLTTWPGFRTAFRRRERRILQVRDADGCRPRTGDSAITVVDVSRPRRVITRRVFSGGRTTIILVIVIYNGKPLFVRFCINLAAAAPRGKHASPARRRCVLCKSHATLPKHGLGEAARVRMRARGDHSITRHPNICPDPLYAQRRPVARRRDDRHHDVSAGTPDRVSDVCAGTRVRGRVDYCRDYRFD